MNRYSLTIFWSVEDWGFIAEVRDLPGCSAWGKTEAEAEAEAAREIPDTIAARLQAARAAKCAIPWASLAAPVTSYGGKFWRVCRATYTRG